MFTQYHHEFYEEVKSKMLELLEPNNEYRVPKLTTKLVAFISNNDNKLKKLDELELIFHNENYFKDSHRGLLNFECDALNDFRNQNITEESINLATESLFICIYADIKSLITLNNDFTIQQSYRNLYLELLSFYEFLSDKSIKVLNMINDVVYFQASKDRYEEHKNFSTHLKELIKNEESINESLEKTITLKEDIELIKNNIENQKREYNFVGLSHGFMSLKNQKKKELCWQHIFYYSLILTILCLIIWKFTWTVKYLESSNLSETIFITTTISSFLVVLLLLYFFKITLNNVKNLKSQILQIDLRLTLCQFIHNYNTDTADLRGEDMKESFEKFESVIFAPIMSTDEKMPSTFDGLAQISKIVSEFKK